MDKGTRKKSTALDVDELKLLTGRPAFESLPRQKAPEPEEAPHYEEPCHYAYYDH
ncbi:MAG: hypothetical protein QM755_16880 [Luteolibacter sp.]